MNSKIHRYYCRAVLMVLFMVTTIHFAIAQHEGHGGGDIPSSPSEEKVVSYNFVCPMHPDVVSDNEGICYKCGMNLEKKELKNKSSREAYFVCPQHTEKKYDKKGKCEKCGKKLKKKIFYSYE